MPGRRFDLTSETRLRCAIDVNDTAAITRRSSPDLQAIQVLTHGIYSELRNRHDELWSILVSHVATESMTSDMAQLLMDDGLAGEANGSWMPQRKAS
jgi:hypothetical protein